ncbi:MAG: response regulator [Myxococcales bacterium]|nr:response regulator [Myxococcales bacterium]
MALVALSASLTALRDGFLPARVDPAGREDPAARAERHRTRRFLSLVLVTGFATSITLLLQLVQRLWLSALGCLAMLLLVGVVLRNVRKGGSLVANGLAFVGFALVVGLGLALVAGRDGMSSLFWIALVPTLGLTVAGVRVARWLLLVTGALVVGAVYVIYSGRFPALVDASRPGPHIGSLLGAMVTYFMLTWAYERETLANVAELERKNEALVEASRVAEAASRAKGEFLAAMSHEIRTPMNGVLGMTDVMLSDELPPHLRDGLRTIRKSGDSLLSLLNDILDLSRIESGTLTIERVPVDIRAEVRSVSGLFESVADERHDQLTVSVDEDVPRFVLGDPLRLRQVVVNLLSNAIKFTESGRVTLQVGYREGVLRIDVEDTGIGIEPDRVQDIFQPFKQGDASTTRRFGGSGLGLAIVQRLLAAMEGAITVESTPKRGSCFSIRVPATACDRPTPEVPSEPRVEGRALRVLLAEDNEINRRVATLMLKSLGHEVVAVENGKDAVERASSERFDVVLMDCYMPELDGFEATRQIRARGLVLPVVALTAASLASERERCLACGMQDVLLKPIETRTLGSVLDQIA